LHGAAAVWLRALPSRGSQRHHLGAHPRATRGRASAFLRLVHRYGSNRVMTGRLIDITGKRFGRWTVVAIYPERRRYGKAGKAIAVLWRCQCDCGEEGIVFGCNLRRGLSKSCGCAAREATRRRNTKHGHAIRGQVTRAYIIWQHAKQRCHNPNNRDYPNYGGRGISMYQDWCSDFQTYYADTNDPPAGMSLDRIDNDGDYSPSNVRWADASTQRANQRPSRPRTKKRPHVGEHRGAADEPPPF
jgi:hypothetical protein